MQASARQAVIIGGGPAGLATALALRQIGWAVAVVDPALPPVDKACGEGLMGQGVQALCALGVDVASLPHAAISGIRFVNGEQSATGRFSGTGGLGVRRTDLHSALVEAAQNAGVTLLWGEPALGISTGDVQLRGTNLPADLIVGADGTNSQVRTWAGLAHGHSTQRFGFRQHFAVQPWSSEVEVHWCALGQAYITPIAANRVGVAWMSDSSTTSLRDMLTELPELAMRLQHATPCTSRRGAISRTQRLTRVTAGNVALVGEASGSVDAITGEGVTLALLQAIALAECVQRGNLRAYNSRHAAILRRPRLMSSALLWMGGHPALRQRAMYALHEHPAVFDQLLNLHTQSKSAKPASAIAWIGAAAVFAKPLPKKMVRKGGLEPPRGLPARS